MWSGAGRGWTPGICFPTHHPAHRDPRPAPGCTASPGPQGAVGRPWAGRWVGSHSSASFQRLQARSPCKRVDPRGRALGRGTCFEFLRCYQWGSRQGLLFTGTCPHQLPWPCLPHWRRRVCLHPSLLPEGGARPHPLLAPPQPAPGYCPAPSSFLGPCAGGGVPVALLVKGPACSGPGVRQSLKGKGAPPCAQCLPLRGQH